MTASAVYFTPADQLGSSSDQSAATALFAGKAPGAVAGRVALAFQSWGSVGIYKASTTTNMVRAWRNPACATDATRWNVADGFSMSWGTAWQVAPTEDAKACVDWGDDPARGVELLNVRRVQPWTFDWRRIFAGMKVGDLVCDEVLVRNGYELLGGPGKVGHGGGPSNRLGVVCADEVRGGAVLHAISLCTYNVAHGPGATALAGFRVEHPGARPDAAGATVPSGDCPGLTIPHGTRLRSTRSPLDIAAWITAKGYTGAKARTARIIATAIAEFGVVVDETSGHDNVLEADTVGDRWSDLGIASAVDAITLLDGFLTPATTAVVRHAVA